MDTDENGVTNGVKVSMFDISDPSDVKEVSKYTLDQYYYSDVFSDYRAALVDPEKNLIGFPLSGSANQYVILSYDKDQGFKRKSTVILILDPAVYMKTTSSM